MARQIDLERWHMYARMRVQGMARAEAARRARVSVASATLFDDGSPRSSGISVWEQYRHRAPFDRVDMVQAAKTIDVSPEMMGKVLAAASAQAPLKPEVSASGAASLGDFEMFRRRFFGRVSTPWQVDAWERMRGHIESREKRYVVLNCPPGTGKTTLLHDIVCRLVAEDRSITGAFVSSREGLASRMTSQVRQSLDRSVPRIATDDEIRMGTAVDASSTLTLDFGPFRPEGRELMWRRSEFYVVQADGSAPGEKDPTWSSYGQDSTILGTRLKVLIADDVETPRSLRNHDSIEDRRQWWRDEVETRLNPGGTLFLVMQRLDPRDLSDYCLAMEVLSDDGEVVVDDLGKPTRKYLHICYPAHDVERCVNDHGRGSQPWPNGCLLDPLRLPPYRELERLSRVEPSTFSLVYQQTAEGVETHALVDRAWVEGGVDRFGVTATGAWDTDRGVWESPFDSNDYQPCVGIVTVDPSGTAWWAVQSWVYAASQEEAREGAGFRFLLSAERVRMGANQLLDYNPDRREFYGMLEDCRKNFERIGLRLDVVIVEVNAAQRYLLQYEHAKRWSATNRVDTIAHTTGQHKLDPALGVPAVATQWRSGRVRLPGRHPWDRQAVDALVRQALRWQPNVVGETDQVMAQWFLEANIGRLAHRLPAENPQPRKMIPSFVRGTWRPNSHIDRQATSISDRLFNRT